VELEIKVALGLDGSAGAAVTLRSPVDVAVSPANDFVCVTDDVLHKVMVRLMHTCAHSVCSTSRELRAHVY
jgi:hypothetical protein